MSNVSKKVAGRLKRKKRVRMKVLGTTAKPRLSVFRSLKNIYVQVIDDSLGVTIAAASSQDKEVADKLKGKSGGNKDAAKLVGKEIAKKIKAKGIKKIVFDRGGYLYHGRVQALADAAREGGLEF